MHMSNTTQLGHLADIFKALSDETRLRILNVLLHGELCVCDIQSVLGASQPNISRHLSYLKHSGLVTDLRQGYRVCYRLIEPRGVLLHHLLAYLRLAFREDSTLRQDLQRLRSASECATGNERLRATPRVAGA